MAGAGPQLMEPDRFLGWCLDKDGRYELVEGVVGASNTELIELLLIGCGIPM